MGTIPSLAWRFNISYILRDRSLTDDWLRCTTRLHAFTVWFAGYTGYSIRSIYRVEPGAGSARPQVGVYGGRTIYSPALVVITAHGGVRVSHETLTLGVKITALVADIFTGF